MALIKALASTQRSRQRVILSREDGEGSHTCSLAHSWAFGGQRSLCEILRFAQDDSLCGRTGVGLRFAQLLF